MFPYLFMHCSVENYEELVQKVKEHYKDKVILCPPGYFKLFSIFIF